MTRKILVTSALPYANGPIHLGHMIEYIQTDIWVRFQQLCGHECHYVCADDAHGTAIMLRAEMENISPEALIERCQKEHIHDFEGFLINHHQYYSTHSKENRHFSAEIYKKLLAKGNIITKEIEQAYDAQEEMFLPDRYIKGQCPKCGAKDQYGDNCEVCGKTYAALDLINPYSVLSQTVPITKETEHYFFDLPQYENFLKGWLERTPVQESMYNKLSEWFVDGLRPWDITRDAPYWGFEIPDKPNKYFYVWLDAPIGYMASFKALCEKKGLDFDEFWHDEEKTELYHFIGKDIAYFHLLFWPAMLEGSGYRKPTNVFCHGFLTVNGAKMSKSRGTFIQAATYLKHFRPEYLRYYFASKLSSKVEDLDLSLNDFRLKVNADLVGKLINLASRCAPFLQKNFAGQLAESLTDNSLFKTFAAKGEEIAHAYENREYFQAIRDIMQLADLANEYIDEQKPWVKIKEKATQSEVQQIATVGINAFRQLIIYLKPVLPLIAQDSEAFLNCPPFVWQDAQSPLLGKKINAFNAMIQRIDEKQINALIEESKEDLANENDLKKGKKEMSIPEITIEDFNKLDLRIAKVIECEAIPEADKLLKFKLDVGELGERQVFSGIKKFHTPEELQGKLVVYISNLKPRKMRFGISEGMILSASDSETLQVLLASGRAKAGMKIS